MRSPGRNRGGPGQGFPSSGRCRHRSGREDYGRGAWCDITNDATLKQIAAAKDMVNKGTHIWRYSHIGQPSLCCVSVLELDVVAIRYFSWYRGLRRDSSA